MLGYLVGIPRLSTDCCKREGEVSMELNVVLVHEGQTGVEAGWHRWLAISDTFHSLRSSDLVHRASALPHYHALSTSSKSECIW